jgi:ATP-dependent DNA helicase Rep
MARNRPDATLGDLIAQLSILDNVDRDDEDRSKMVSLMTLHAAKGLEFDQVFLVGMEENLLPHHACQEGAALDEERRLAYVGITRARRRLTVTHARSRKRFGETLDCVPSRFLEELPQDEVEWEKRDGNVSADERRQRGRAAIADLRSLLGEG